MTNTAGIRCGALHHQVDDMYTPQRHTSTVVTETCDHVPWRHFGQDNQRHAQQPMHATSPCNIDHSTSHPDEVPNERMETHAATTGATGHAMLSIVNAHASMAEGGL